MLLASIDQGEARRSQIREGLVVRVRRKMAVFEILVGLLVGVALLVAYAIYRSVELASLARWDSPHKSVS